MFDRFTDHARQAMGYSRQEALRLSRDYIGTEHILLGLARTPGCIAAGVFRNLGIQPAQIVTAVEKRIERGNTMVTMGQLPFTPRAKKVLEYALEESSQLGHNYIGTEHLLLGVIREREGIGAVALSELGVVLDDVRKDVVEQVGTDESATGEARVYDPVLRVSDELEKLKETNEELRRRVEDLERRLKELGDP